MMVCMNTHVLTNNERLRQLVHGTGLSQPAALTLFNRGFGIRGLKESTWKGYFCDPSTTRYRNLSDEMLAHAEKVFGPLQKTS
jgi:hypothetical protein